MKSFAHLTLAKNFTLFPIDFGISLSSLLAIPIS
jgi:hypothetical protein